MAEPLPWPSELKPASEDWSLRGGTRSGGQTFQGNEQTVASPTARWKASLTVPCSGRAQILALRRVLALGRSQLWTVGPYEIPRAPWNVDFIGGKIVYGHGIEGGQDTAAALDFKAFGDSLISSTQLQIARYKGGVLEPGMLFTVAGRLYTIVGLTGETGIPGRQGAPNTTIMLSIRPWLRQVITDGTPVEFGAPICVMRLASDDTAGLDLQFSRSGTATIELVEAF
jgi:hypothetical protein